MTITFGERLKWAREKNTMSVENMAKELNISFSSYYKYERNEREPNFDMLIRISAILNISIDYLLGINVDTDIHIDNWLLEINYSSNNKKEAMKTIWEQVKKL